MIAALKAGATTLLPSVHGSATPNTSRTEFFRASRDHCPTLVLLYNIFIRRGHAKREQAPSSVSADCARRAYFANSTYVGSSVVLPPQGSTQTYGSFSFRTRQLTVISGEQLDHGTVGWADRLGSKICHPYARGEHGQRDVFFGVMQARAWGLL